MTYLRIFGAIGMLAAVFAFGMWLTWRPSARASELLSGRKFVAVSFNNQPVISSRRGVKIPTLELKERPDFGFSVSGAGHCNYFHGQVSLYPRRRIIWGDVRITAMGCSEWKLEERYLKALFSANRWRTEEGFLILENGTDVIRFLLAPRKGSD
jgi:heat shock protein HslJ